jgi:hypothetical protein
LQEQPAERDDLEDFGGRPGSGHHRRDGALRVESTLDVPLWRGFDQASQGALRLNARGKKGFSGTARLSSSTLERLGPVHRKPKGSRCAAWVVLVSVHPKGDPDRELRATE